MRYSSAQMLSSSRSSSSSSSSTLEDDPKTKTYYVQIAKPLAVSVPIDVRVDQVRDYVWCQHGEQLRHSLAVRQEARVLNELEQYKRRFELLDRVAQAQSMYLQGESRKDVFQCLLDGLLELMNSEYGFIGHVEYDEDQTMHLRTDAIKNIAWNEATHKLYEENLATGLRFSNMRTLFGYCLVHKEPVISNHPASDPRSAGLPSGHPALNHFLGIPFFCKGEIVGMIGISNRPGGYTTEDLRYLEPFTVTCSSLIQSFHQKDMNDELINTLEEKVKERTQKLEMANLALAKANRKIVQASQTQLEHFACMSHEIRTPLNCILGLSSLLQETTLDAKQADAVQMMTTSGDLLLAVVNDVLDYSKLTTGNVEIEVSDTSLQETLNAVIHSIEAKAGAKQISVQVDCSSQVPPIIPTDGRRLQQILYNLLGNAVKFSRPSSVIDLKVSTVEKREINIPEDTPPSPTTCPHAQRKKAVEACPHLLALESVPDERGLAATSCRNKDQEQESQCRTYLRFDVIDYGKGIPRADFERIFQPFVQSGSDTEANYGGTGLGLAITSKLVRALGGTVQVDSIEGKKTVFTVDLPLPSDYLDKLSIRDSLGNISIILVGASEATQAWMSKVVDDFGVQATFSNSLKETMNKLIEEQTARPVVLVQEDLFTTDLRLRSKTESLKQATFLTFGSQYNVPSAASHFRCLERMIPAVLLQSLASQILKASPSPISQIRRLSALRNGDFRVLVAEDNIVNQKVLKKLLAQIGLKHIRVVDNGQKAWETATNQEFDVILMDQQMPVCNGLDACRLILSDDRIKRKPKIVLVTADVSKSVEQQAIKAGCVAFLPKPFNLRDIENTFQNLHRDMSSFDVDPPF